MFFWVSVILVAWVIISLFNAAPEIMGAIVAVCGLSVLSAFAFVSWL
tara:strand:- start:8126 stop:8266 length:141 start_codon:yes stop_codon:yes gene_type:complete